MFKIKPKSRIPARAAIMRPRVVAPGLDTAASEAPPRKAERKEAQSGWIQSAHAATEMGANCDCAVLNK